MPDNRGIDGVHYVHAEDWCRNWWCTPHTCRLMQGLMIYAMYMQWVDAGIDDVCYIHAAECYSDLKGSAFWHMLQDGWISWTWCWLKPSKHWLSLLIKIPKVLWLMKTGSREWCLEGRGFKGYSLDLKFPWVPCINGLLISLWHHWMVAKPLQES